jgi:hypothetical protein
MLPGLHKLVLQRLQGDLSATSCVDKTHKTGTQRYRVDYSRVMATHLHPLLGLADCLQVPGHRRRID